MIRKVLSIAGSDPSGGAGIQADLKTCSALGCYGMSAITALTAQNTQGVSGVHFPPAQFVRDQMVAIFEDGKVDAVKIGMAGTPEIIANIAEVLIAYKPEHIVLDPVMVATSGDTLLDRDAIETLKQSLLPLASVVTPNIPEAEILSGQAMDREALPSMECYALDVLASINTKAVYLKGGHLEGKVCKDVLATKGQKTESYETPRIDTKNTHGTGCTLSTAIACYLANGLPLEEACQAAKQYLTRALSHADALKVGKGAGPVHHMFAQWSEEE